MAECRDARNLRRRLKAKTYKCQCDTCKSMCSHHPCQGTPQEIQRIIDAGHADKLNIVLRYVCYDLPNIEVLAPASIGHQRKRDEAYSVSGRCSFLSDSGECLINKLKGVEGRIAIHPPYPTALNKFDVRDELARLWDSKPGREIVRKWKKLVGFRE